MPYLSIDIGSSVVKAAYIAEDGRLIGLARRPAPMRHDGQAHEADALAWIEGAASASAELAGLYPGTEVRAVSVSGNGPTLLAAGADGLPLGPALSWMDRRAVPEAAEVSRIVEMPVDPSFYLPKALRLWRSSAELRGTVRWFFSCPEYLIYVLSGEAVTYLPHPGYAPYIWDSALLKALELPAERFPPFVAPSRRVGSVASGVAQRFGLKAGTPVVAGFPDFLASIVGSAAVEPGIACDRGGTSEALNLCATRPFPGRELLSLPHAIDGLWNVSAGLSTAGKALEWLASSLGYPGGTGTDGAQDPGATAALLAEASSSAPGARGLLFLPYLAGERAPLWEPDRRGAFVGLSLSHERGDLARAACESIVYGLRQAAELAKGAGFRFSLVRTSGSPARDGFLNALKADVLGVPV
ncbi:MAG TPA: FGGY-family carbohydrate kinase, partial [Rectinemataceae bacterium]|nr:FGGY-family carbohydrate kinase [Rectinemataceae bacterium]